ncbi:MAG: alpha/beta hydrolase [Chloroflexota bacterium]
MGQKSPPILFIHGAWHGKWCYEKYFLDYFTNQGFEAYALDLPNHGQKFTTKRELRWKSLNDYVEEVAAFADSLESKPIVVGHSMGGGVVQKYLEKYEAPAGVLLASMPPSGVGRISLNIFRHHPWRFLKSNLTLSLYPLIDTPKLARQHFFSADMSEKEVEEYWSQMHDESFRAFLDMLILGLPKPDLVNSKMLVLGGEKDTIFSVSQVKATAAAYNTDAIIYDGMAHDMMVEADWQNVADDIIEWVNKL